MTVVGHAVFFFLFTETPTYILIEDISVTRHGLLILLNHSVVAEFPARFLIQRAAIYAW